MARPAIQRYFAGLSRNTFLLALASLFADISTEMLYPVLPVFLTQTLKASGSIVGLVDGFAQATQNIVQGFSGALSDKLQKRKSIALAGYLLAAVAKPLMGLSTVWQGVFGARLLDRLGAGTRSAPRDALIASSVDEKDRGRAFGLEGVGDNAGAFLGPLLAVFLLYSLHVGIRAIFYLAIIPGLLAFFMVLLVKEQPCGGGCEIKDRCQPAAVSEGLLEISAGDRLVRNRQLQQRVSDPANAGYRRLPGNDDPDLRGIQSGGRADFLSGRVSFRQVGQKNILLASFIIFLIAYLGFALTQNILLIAALFVFYGLYQGIFALSARRSRRISCQSICAPAASAGTAPPSACCNSWPASLPGCCGIGSAMRPCSITVRLLPSSAASDYCSC